jgi:hypothetical protein
VTHICGVGPRCERHERALHGYPCHACAEEHWRRYPKTRALIHKAALPTERGGRHITPREFTAARKRDEADRAAYDGPHLPWTEPAGETGPVRRLWNALCVPDCGWSHFWLPTHDAAEKAALAHAEAHP